MKNQCYVNQGFEIVPNTGFGLKAVPSFSEFCSCCYKEMFPQQPPKIA